MPSLDVLLGGQMNGTSLNSQNNLRKSSTNVCFSHVNIEHVD